MKELLIKIGVFIKLVRDYIRYRTMDPDETVIDETERNIYDDIVPKA